MFPSEPEADLSRDPAVRIKDATLWCPWIPSLQSQCYSDDSKMSSSTGKEAVRLCEHIVRQAFGPVVCVGHPISLDHFLN